MFCFLLGRKEHFVSYTICSSVKWVQRISGSRGSLLWERSSAEIYPMQSSRPCPEMLSVGGRMGDPAHVLLLKHYIKSVKPLVSVVRLQLWGFSSWTMFSSAVPYKNQHYAELKTNCIRDKTLFEDPEFPAANESLYFRRPPPGIVQWKRPAVSDPSPAFCFYATNL